MERKLIHVKGYGSLNVWEMFSPMSSTMLCFAFYLAVDRNTEFTSFAESAYADLAFPFGFGAML